MPVIEALGRGFGLIGRLWSRMAHSGWVLAGVLVLGLAGPRIYMNLRPGDPLPPRFEVYSPDALAAAQSAGGVVLIHVYASWCPTCMAQYQVLDTLLRDDRYASVRGIRVDFDRDRDIREQLQVNAQSVLLMFEGERELSRTAGVTSPAAIRAQLDAAMRFRPEPDA
jgi:thiol-disulfide isomerase/thioredoxin